jgi:hypothetical protein
MRVHHRRGQAIAHQAGRHLPDKEVCGAVRCELCTPNALLVSPFEVPERLVRLARVVVPLLQLPAYKQVTLVRRDDDGTRVEWFPEDPFAGVRS